MTSVQPITRFAPSPTGHLHLGHVLSALWVWAIAKQHKAKVLLRIEDHDRQRYRPEYLDSIMKDLAWLGFHAADECYLDSITPHPDFVQSQQFERYESFARQHRQKLYVCSCSRKWIKSRKPKGYEGEPIYPNFCRDRNLELDSDRCLRWRVPEGDVSFDDLLLGRQNQQPNRHGDLSILGREGNWQYLWAATIDDQLQRVNLIVRGADLLKMTGKQTLLAQDLGIYHPVDYLHHPLLLDEQGAKLSKRFGSEALASWRAKSYSPQQLLAKALRLGGLTPQIDRCDLSEAIELLLNFASKQGKSIR